MTDARIGSVGIGDDFGKFRNKVDQKRVGEGTRTPDIQIHSLTL